MIGAHAGAGISADGKIRALETVLQSDTFARSERLKSLLRYLCEAEIEGREGELNEYSIATGALGRPNNFAPLEDSSVRSRVHELRQRLEKYYTHEAPASPVRIELRKGSYVPRFCAAPAEELAVQVIETLPVIEETSTTAASVLALHPAKSVVRIASLAFAAGALAVLAVVGLWWNIAPSRSVRPGWTPELETLWRPFLAQGASVIVTFETRFFVQMGPLVVRDSHVNGLAAAEASEPLRKVQQLFGVRQLYETGNYTDVGAPEAMFHLTQLLNSRARLSVKNSREISAGELRDNNLILVGKPWFDPQIEGVLAAADLVDADGRVLNRHPGPGEEAEYKDRHDKTDPDWSEKYSVIAMMPNPAGGKRILALTASGSEHPAALAYYVTNRDTVRELVQHLRNGTGGMPENYQVLIRTTFKGKSLVKVTYVTWRPLKT